MTMTTTTLETEQAAEIARLRQRVAELEQRAASSRNAQAYAVGGIAADMTEHRQVTEAYRALVDHSIQGFAIYQKERFVFVNETMARITGYSVEELLAFSLEEILAIIFSDDLPMALRHQDTLLSEASIPVQYAHRMVRKDGEIRWVEGAAVQTYYRGSPAIQAAFIDVTDRVQTEEALRQSEERYRTIITTMHEGVILHGKDGTICEWNDRAKQLLGRTTEKLIGLSTGDPHWRAIHEDGTPFAGMNHPSLVALRTGRPCSNVVMGIYRPDSTLTWLLVNAQPLFHTVSPSPGGAVATFTDITDLKRTEQALRESEQRFRAIFEHAGMGIVLATPEGKIGASNAAFQQLVGYSNEELQHMAFQTITHPDDVVTENALYREMLMRGESSSEIEKRYIRKDGQSIWCRITVSLVRDDIGTPQFAIVMVKDITERKKAEEALTTAYRDLEATTEQLVRSRDLLRTLFDGLPDGLVLLDSNGVVLATNQAFATILHRHPDDLLGQSWFAICEQDVPPFPADLVTRTLKDGIAHRRRERYAGLDKTPHRVLDIQTLPIVGKRETLDQVVVHIADVTEQLSLEAIAIQHERLAASSALAATIAHEINTPLQSINHCLFLAYDVDDPQRDTYLTMARDEIARISQIVRQLLEIHRPTSSKPVFFSILPLIERVLTLTRGTLEKQTIAVESDLARDLPALWGHADQITQVLMNLVMNAKNAMPDGGTLSVRTMLRDNSAAPALPLCSDPDQQADMLQTMPGPQNSRWAIVVEVEDTGVGMSPEIQARAFESFFTTGTGGSGLGLTISQKIMKQHGGRITLSSEPGKGSIFHLIFPITGSTPTEIE